MKRSRSISLFLVAALVCLGACGPKAEGDRGTKSVTEADSDSEKPTGEKNRDREENDHSGEEAPQGAGAEEGEPVVLSLMTNSRYDDVWEDSQRICYSNYRKIWLDDGEGGDAQAGAKGFPQLAQALEELNDETEKSVGKTMEELESQAREQVRNGYFQPLSCQSDSWAVRADSQVLSILTSDSVYMGGAHGDYGYSGITFDSQSGRKMELTEVVTDLDRLVELASDRLTEKYPDVDFFEPPRNVLQEEAENGSLVWTVGYQGITLYFNPYELAPYAYGMQSVTILYEEAQELFVPELCRVPGSWAVCLAPGMDFDLGHDGILDTVEAGGVYGEYGGDSAYEQFRVSVNGQESRKELWFYRGQSYLVHSDDLDTELLIAETTSDNDFQITLVYELDGEKEGFWAPWEFSGHGFFRFYEEMEDGDFRDGTKLFTDPEHFRMQAHFDLLSTYSGSRWYGISEAARDEGYLTAEKPWYDVDRGDRYLTLLMPLEMEVGDTGETRILPEGTKLWIVRVEGENVRFRTEDWIQCQVHVDPSEWPGRVDGIDASAIFDGMMFAG